MNGNNSETWWKIPSNRETRTPILSQDLLQAGRCEHWAKRLKIEIERNVAALPNSADGITFGELIQSYKKRGIES